MPIDVIRVILRFNPPLEHTQCVCEVQIDTHEKEPATPQGPRGLVIVPGGDA